VHSWFALASIAIGFMVSSIAMKIRAVARSASSSLEVPKSLILLGSMASMLFVFNLFVVLYSVPLLDQYADDSEEWLDVAQTYMVGIGQPDAVGDSPAQEWEEPYPLSTIDSIPTSSVITLGYFCTGVMPLLTPLVFLTSKQYMEAIGIKFGKGSKKSGKIAAASTKMSTRSLTIPNLAPFFHCHHSPRHHITSSPPRHHHHVIITTSSPQRHNHIIIDTP
jgi:hypothetical protein